MKIIYGRSDGSKPNSPMNCREYAVVEALQKRGLPIRVNACDPSSGLEADEDEPAVWSGRRNCDKCPAFEWCESHGYESQFKGEKADVYIFAHNYLFIPKRKELPDPDLIVVDESFLGHATRSVKLELGELVGRRADLRTPEELHTAEVAKLEREREERARKGALAAGRRGARAWPRRAGPRRRSGPPSARRGDKAYARVMAKPVEDPARARFARNAAVAAVGAIVHPEGATAEERSAEAGRVWDAAYAAAYASGGRTLPRAVRGLAELCKVVLDALVAGEPEVAALRAKGFTVEG